MGAQVAVRRANGWAGHVRELTPAILEQMRVIKENFLQNLPGSTIIKIEYIMNDTLYKQFNDTKAKFRNSPRKSTKEVLLFHGTKPENIDKYLDSKRH